MYQFHYQGISLPLEIEIHKIYFSFFQVEAFQRDSSEEEEARVAAERRKRSIRRPPKIHAQVGCPVVRCFEVIESW